MVLNLKEITYLQKLIFESMTGIRLVGIGATLYSKLSKEKIKIINDLHKHAPGEIKFFRDNII